MFGYPSNGVQPKELKMKVIYVMQNDDNTYEYEGVTKIDDRTDSRRIKGYKNDELLFDIDRGLLKNFHTID